jgi:hypothetical protein
MDKFRECKIVEMRTNYTTGKYVVQFEDETYYAISISDPVFSLCEILLVNQSVLSAPIFHRNFQLLWAYLQ